MAKLKWGMIGGGEGSQIGPAHRLGAQADGNFTISAGALDAEPAKGKAYAQSLGIEADRAYGNWQEMLAGERNRDDKVDLVTVATPNNTHFEITKSFLEAGFNVLCEKPMTMTVQEGEEIVRVAKSDRKGLRRQLLLLGLSHGAADESDGRGGRAWCDPYGCHQLQPRTSRGRRRCRKPTGALAV